MFYKRVVLSFLVLFFSLPLYISGVVMASEKSSEEIFKEFGVQKFSEPVKAPEFTMMNLEGKEIKLKDYLGKVVLLTFFTTD